MQKCKAVVYYIKCCLQLQRHEPSTGNAWTEAVGWREHVYTELTYGSCKYVLRLLLKIL